MNVNLNIEKLAAFSLSMTGEYCADTMLAHFAAQNPLATDSEINDAHLALEDFVENAL